MTLPFPYETSILLCRISKFLCRKEYLNFHFRFMLHVKTPIYTEYMLKPQY